MAPSGSIDMDPDAVDHVGHRLGVIGHILQLDWPGLLRQIEAAETGIRADVLGVQYRKEYVPSANAIREKADPVPGRYQELATRARTAAATYAQADRVAAGGFPK